MTTPETAIDADARAYIDAIAPEHRPHFDRLHHLIVSAFPQASVRLSYRMPTYVVGTRQLHVAVWKHGLSLYGWQAGRDGGLIDRHPELANDKGTLRLRPSDLARLDDRELLGFVRGSLGD